MMFWIGELYWGLRAEGDVCRSELRERIREYFRALGCEPSEAQLDGAATDNATLTPRKGPYETAKQYSLASAAGSSGR